MIILEKIVEGIKNWQTTNNQAFFLLLISIISLWQAETGWGEVFWWLLIIYWGLFLLFYPEILEGRKQRKES